MILVIDNYDSFTFNLVQLLGGLGVELKVVRNDALSVDGIRSLAPERIVVSPGPCTPREAGVSVEAIRTLGVEIPLLGVCLGHQALGEAFGGRTIRAPAVMHGKTSAVRHTGTGLFAGLPSPLTVARYHSLVTDPAALPECLEPVAWSGGGATREPELIQAMRHRDFPIWGVQFHPESLFSEGGVRMMENFLRL